MSLEEQVIELEKEAAEVGNLHDTLQNLIEKGLNKELGKGSQKKKAAKRKRNESHLDPPHSDGDCLEKEEKKEEVEDVIFDDDIDFSVEQESKKKRRVALELPEDSDSWSVSRQIEWLSSHPNLE